PGTHNDDCPLQAIAPLKGWSSVANIAEGGDEVASIQAIVEDSSTLSRPGDLLLRVLTHSTEPPTIYLDTDGDRVRGGWTYQTPVSAAGWDLHIDPEGTLHQHAGNPDVWEWSPVANLHDFMWESVDGETTVRLPAALLEELTGEWAGRIRVSAQHHDQWLPPVFFDGALYPPEPDGPESTPVRAPGRLALAYQWAPWAIRDCDPSGEDLGCASAAYGKFNHIVLAAGLQDPRHPSHAKTVLLIERLRTDHPETEIWGYVSLLRHAADWYGVEGVSSRAQQWQSIGATGIFLDEFDLCEAGWRTCPVDADGREVAVTRERQREAVASVHSLGMPVFVNAHSIHGVFGPVRGLATALGSGGAERLPDMYLLENPTAHADRWWTGLDMLASVARFHIASRYLAEHGVRLAVVDTAAEAVADDVADDVYRASWWRALMAGAEAHAFTNPTYSATDELGSNIPILEPPSNADLAQLQSLSFVGHVETSGDGLTSVRLVANESGVVVGEVRIKVNPETGAVDGGFVELP
ncbi:MAG: hypothetical protein WD532_00225, partial [Acidimicrobiia bacterium]